MPKPLSPSMSRKPAAPRASTFASCIEITKICDSANATRWRNWSSPLIALRQNAWVVPSWAVLGSHCLAGGVSGIPECQIAEAGFANCSSIQAL